jgi:hypothetical protein
MYGFWNSKCRLWSHDVLTAWGETNLVHLQFRRTQANRCLLMDSSLSYEQTRTRPWAQNLRIFVCTHLPYKTRRILLGRTSCVVFSDSEKRVVVTSYSHTRTIAVDFCQEKGYSYFLCHQVKTGSWTFPETYQMITVIQRMQRETDHVYQFSSDVQENVELYLHFTLHLQRLMKKSNYTLRPNECKLDNISEGSIQAFILQLQQMKARIMQWFKLERDKMCCRNVPYALTWNHKRKQ